MRRDLCIARLHFHEPALGAAERAFLAAHCASTVHPTNVEGRHRLAATGKHTLVFLPHCPKQLTNNFLWANWRAATLRNCTLLCNSFAALCAAQPHRFLAVDAAFIVRLQLGHTVETALPNTFRQRDIFNDTALHRFDAVPDAFCERDPVRPVYAANASELICAPTPAAAEVYCEAEAEDLVEALSAIDLSTDQ